MRSLRRGSVAWRTSLLGVLLVVCAPAALASVQPDMPFPVRIEEISDKEFVAIGVRQSQQPSKSASSVGLQSDAVPAPAHGAHVSGDDAKALAPKGAELRCNEFPDGMAVLVYRGGLGAEDLDVFCRVRSAEGTWAAPAKIGREGWRRPERGTAQCLLMPGSFEPAGLSFPFSVSTGFPRETVAWYTEADKEPRVLVSQSPDAGLRWTAPMRADLGAPVGGVSAITLSDGTIYVAWLERAQGDDPSLPGGIYLRRYAPNGASSAPALLALVDPATVRSGVVLYVEDELPGGSGRILAAYAVGEAAPRTLRITLPSREALLELDQSCRCGPVLEPGVPVRARIRSLDTKARAVVLEHGAVPGLLRAGELRVVLDPAVDIAALHVGTLQQVRIGGDDRVGWQLLSVRSADSDR